MSGPNDTYDPKQVAALSDDELAKAAVEARRAFGDAGDLDELAALKPAHLGDRSPLLAARREIGALPPQARSDAGRRLNEALGTVQRAFEQRRAELAAERDEAVLREEAVDVTLAWGRTPRGWPRG